LIDARFDVVAFLSGRYIAALATLQGDGASYLTAIWYLYMDGAFYFPTSRGSRKARNIAARPRASVMVDSRAPQLIRGVAARGQADLISREAAREMNRLIHRRYLTEKGLRESSLGRAVAEGDDVTIRLVAERWHTWDLSGPFGNVLTSAELVLPLDG
jgi:PPOX class probable F420-dependent enzyme